MSEIDKIHHLAPKTLETYRNEYARGAKIFKEALDEYSKTDEYHKKEQLKKAMEESLDAMNKLANYVLRDMKMADKLSSDYQNLAQKDSNDAIKQLNRDIDSIQKYIS